jgi:hypothetical protein
MRDTASAMTASRIGAAARTLRGEVFALQDFAAPDLVARLFPPGLDAGHLIADLDMLISACFAEVEAIEDRHDRQEYLMDIHNDGRDLP